jgi:hypothetical protein
MFGNRSHDFPKLDIGSRISRLRLVGQRTAASNDLRGRTFNLVRSWSAVFGLSRRLLSQAVSPILATPMRRDGRLLPETVSARVPVAVRRSGRLLPQTIAGARSPVAFRPLQVCKSILLRTTFTSVFATLDVIPVESCLAQPCRD